MFTHLPVLVREAVSLLGCKAGGVYVDCTIGGGGHAKEVLRSCPDVRLLVGMDRDSDAIAAARRSLAQYSGKVALIKEDYRKIKAALAALSIKEVDGILMDLGVSSYQFDTPERGFSFRFDARLDMRMDRDQELSAYELVNGADEAELTRIFREYGEERFARKIAKAIVEARKSRPVETTGQLASIAEHSVPVRFHAKGVHPATRIFQALRIAVNEELTGLDGALRDCAGLLVPGGRLAVISFHSLEDRIVKDTFRDLSTGCVCPPKFPVCVCGRLPSARLLARKPVTATPEELDRNPRARSAKLRAIEKI